MAEPYGVCSCGTPACDITARLTYQGNNTWSLPEFWSARAIGFRGSPRLTRWRITDAQGHRHGVCTRD